MNPRSKSADSAPALLNSIETVKRRLALGHTATYGLVRAGRLKIVKVGRRSFVTESELARFVASIEAESSTR